MSCVIVCIPKLSFAYSSFIHFQGLPSVELYNGLQTALKKEMLRKKRASSSSVPRCPGALLVSNNTLFGIDFGIHLKHDFLIFKIVCLSVLATCCDIILPLETFCLFGLAMT